ncbi:2478_t:CDS:1, partial [Gigaspora rosea]
AGAYLSLSEGLAKGANVTAVIKLQKKLNLSFKVLIETMKRKYEQ